ncbi:MAG TPA: CSLREA domain-containing protein [Anaerolineae bacterium]|nr:CSLREA domain-containing protein [Anaerolineae bacterium]
MRNRHRRLLRCLVLGLSMLCGLGLLRATIALAAFGVSTPASSSTYTVNSTLDEPNPDTALHHCISYPSGKCTLRAAIQQANTDNANDTIIIPAGIYAVTRPGYDDAALVGDLDIAHDLTIQGAGSSQTIIDGNGSVTHDRVFQILSSATQITLTGMTIRNGESLSSTVGIIGGGGLLIEGAGHLSLSHVVIQDNTAQNGGGLYANFSNQGGSLAMDHVIMSTNVVTAGGVGAGGGVFASLLSGFSQITLQDSQIYSNTADGTGGGLFVSGTDLAHWSIQRSDIYSNTAASGGGIGNFTPLTLSDSEVHDNHVSFDGGGIEAFSPLVILRTALNANSANRYGGGLFDLPTGSSALYDDFAHIEQSTLSNNSAQDGGGIYHDGYINYPSVLTLINSTFSGNAVSRDGGGLLLYSGQAQLLNTTIADNRVQLHFPNPGPGVGGGLFITATSTFTAENSLIGANLRGNGIMPWTFDDCYSYGNFGELGFNLIQTIANCYITGPQVGNITGQNPRLGPLQNNGGSTLTQAPLAGSPAIDQASDLICPPIDQRGFHRPIGSHCDIGAVEYSPYALDLPLILR